LSREQCAEDNREKERLEERRCQANWKVEFGRKVEFGLRIDWLAGASVVEWSVLSKGYMTRGSNWTVTPARWLWNRGFGMQFFSPEAARYAARLPR
jgi:hypothetical protein